MASSFVYVMEEGPFLLNDVIVPDNTQKKARKFGKKVFKDLYVLYFLAINALRMSSKCSIYK